MQTSALDALRILQKELARRQVEEIPEGTRTVEQWAKEWGFSGSHTERILRQSVAAGLVERQDFAVQRGNRVLRVPHYRMAK